jgi:hypothetical protein
MTLSAFRTKTPKRVLGSPAAAAYVLFGLSPAQTGAVRLWRLFKGLDFKQGGFKNSGYNVVKCARPLVS